ncbi:MAG: hypothetical protein GXO43_06010 [Crenarchaeota archaeon]|nr:hypothetical protein [Thermoproteota archaeon]
MGWKKGSKAGRCRECWYYVGLRSGGPYCRKHHKKISPYMERCHDYLPVWLHYGRKPKMTMG